MKNIFQEFKEIVSSVIAIAWIKYSERINKR